MTSLAAVPDVEAIWRPLTSPETARAGVLLTVASARVRQRFSDIDARITSGGLDAALVTYVVATMVKRVLEVRSGDQAVQEAIGEASRTWRQSDGGEDAVILTDDLASLLAPAGSRAGRPGSARVGVGLPLP